MSEGTPGRGPDADSRTDNGEGQAPTNGRPVVPPVRYGPRNGSPSGGPNGRGTTGRTVPGPSAPQQYRAPQPPRPANGTTGPGTNGTGGNGSNGSGSNGAHTTGPGSYTRPRTNDAPARPEPSEQERLVTDARTAAAARNARAAKVRGGGSATAPAAAPADETSVIPAVTSPAAGAAEPSSPSASTTEETVTPEKGRTVFGRLRERRSAKEAQAPAAVQAPTEPVATEPTTAELTTPATPAVVPDTVETSTAEAPAVEERETPTELVAAVATEQDTGTQERPLTWRDRLGLPAKEAKAEPSAVPEAKPDTTGPDATEPTEASEPAPVQDRVTPSAPVTTTDTVIIPAVDAGAVGTATPALAAAAPATPTAQPLATPKSKVGAARRTRKARLRLSRVDPWSVMKTALLFSIAAGIILVVATYGVWSVLNASGLFDAVNDMVKSVVSTPGDTTPFRIEEYVNTQKIIGVAALIAVVDVLIFTALATLGSFLYNLAATVLGGLEVTLAED